ncbi:MAG: SpoIIE family protein phosphatase, partial [Mogibacterium sp.]|nr:SpoIIE family protein phosphatase [Mogibacterium sp.]
DSRRVFIEGILKLMLAMLTLVAVGVFIFLRRTIIEPVRSIEAEARRFAEQGAGPDDGEAAKLTDTIRSIDEIGSLAASIDQMEVQIREYVDDITMITAEKERIGAELDLARRIQRNALPSNFPAFPERKVFDVYASMTPAKEVGGDFYDFFFIDSDHLGIVIADVSGKGIPAALFMMVSKIMIKNQVLAGANPAEALEAVNEQACRSNSEEMFVTVWLGILNLKTGHLVASNAGHEFPVLKDSDGDFEVMKDKHGFVVGGMDGMKYINYNLQVKPGWKLFVYTDGLPEAQDTDKQFFGMDRIVETLNVCKDSSPKEIIDSMDKAVNAFENGEPAFDDLTMLCLEYKGWPERKA